MLYNMLFLFILLVAIFYMATTTTTQSGKYSFSLLVLLFLVADLNLHDPEITLIMYVVLGTIGFGKLLIDFSFISLPKNVMSFFFLSLALFSISNAIMMKDKAAVWISTGSKFTTLVLIFWLLNLFDLIQISYLRHFFFVHFIQKHKEEKRRKKDNKGEKGKKEE